MLEAPLCAKRRGVFCSKNLPFINLDYTKVMV
jgi:hypothetical protein